MNTQKKENIDRDYDRKIDEFESKLRNRFTISGSSLLGDPEAISNFFNKDESTYENYVVVTVDFERATLREASNFKKFLETIISKDNKGIIVNLNKCDFIDSSFFGVLVGAVKRMKAMDRNFFLVYDSKHQLPIFSATGLDKVFTVFDSVEEAVQQ
jgi:anti-sigma B factor antagonist